jgi:hypothetical protein
MAQDTDFGRDITDGVKDQLKAENLMLAGETLHNPSLTPLKINSACSDLCGLSAARVALQSRHVRVRP